jgi:hypothetical protein
MPYTKKTLADLRQSLADRHNNGKVPTSSDVLSLWTRLFNRGKDYCARKLQINSKTSLTTSGGTIACPTAFLVVDTVYNSDEEPLTQIKEAESTGATGNYYWISGNHQDGFYFNVPTDNDGTFTIHEATHFPDMSLTTDICIIPDEEAVVAYAYSFLRRSESDPFEDAESSLQECDSRLSELISNQNANESNLELSIF